MLAFFIQTCYKSKGNPLVSMKACTHILMISFISNLWDITHEERKECVM